MWGLFGLNPAKKSAWNPTGVVGPINPGIAPVQSSQQTIQGPQASSFAVDKPLIELNLPEVIFSSNNMRARDQLCFGKRYRKRGDENALAGFVVQEDGPVKIVFHPWKGFTGTNCYLTFFSLIEEQQMEALRQQVAQQINQTAAVQAAQKVAHTQQQYLGAPQAAAQAHKKP